LQPHGNLFGTFHTLDGINGSVSMNCTVDNAAGNSVGFGSEPLAHCSWGLVSKAGWALVDDSFSPVFPPGSGWPVPQTSGTCNASVQIPCFRDKQYNPTTQGPCEAAGCCFGGANGCFKRTGNVDWYLFTHGLDYVGAMRDSMRDFTRIAGTTPMPRRHWLGFSWSRWGNNLTQETSYEQLQQLEATGFPLSTYIFDMNWHLKVILSLIFAETKAVTASLDWLDLGHGSVSESRAAARFYSRQRSGHWCQLA
jgi:alpha-glucosidase (family GH31 glycosyl hydrolase)